MAKLNGSIQKIINISGSVSKTLSLTGSLQKVHMLKGSVENFVRSLTTRATLVNRILLTCNAYMILKPMNVLASTKVQITAYGKVLKNAFADFNTNIQIIVNAKILRKAQAIVGVEFVIGKSSILQQIKNRVLGDLKTLTLKQLTFAMGVQAYVIRRLLNLQLFNNIQITASAKIYGKTTLGEIKGQTLGQIKTLTLQELVEYEK